MSTPESNAMINKLYTINNNIRSDYYKTLRKNEKSIYKYKYKSITDIFTHIRTILITFKKGNIIIDNECYYYVMYCGNILLSAIMFSDYRDHRDHRNHHDYQTNDKLTLQSKYIMALFFLNYIKKFTTHEFRNNYVCNLNEYISSFYKNIYNSKSDITSMIMVYMNLKKIVYVKKYPYLIDGKIFSIMLDYWVLNNYTISEIPTTYIKSDIILQDNELSAFDVYKRDIDKLFGTYLNIAHATPQLESIDDSHLEIEVEIDLDQDQDISTNKNDDVGIDDIESVIGIQNDEYISIDEVDINVYQDDVD